ncbi:MAG: MAPEG family protein [Gammaproteobacteria bacterium]|nr:MAPEG family protein [Gammaproteobacteria bacterium]
MRAELIFIPVLIQITLTLVVYVALGRAKEIALKKGEVDTTRRGMHDDAWPATVQKINNNIKNQFETPILFYVLIILLWLLGAANLLAQLTAWIYAITRVMHAYVHTGSNDVPLRKRLFQSGIVLLFVLTALTIFAVIS